MNEILKQCDGYKRLKSSEPLYDLLEPYYHMEKSMPVLCATPWKMVHEVKNDVAVLLLHGYTGYPGEMIFPGQKLYEAGFDVYCPRYPGHGVGKKDFLNTNGEDWLATARSSIGYLKKEYSDVYVVGHSMGGLIATIVAKEFDVTKLALIAPAFALKGFNKTKVLLLRLFKDEVVQPWKMDKDFWGICERDEKDDAFLGENYWSYINLNMILELNKLRETALNSLNKINSKTICILGEYDSSVDNKKINKFLKSKVKSPLEILEIEGVTHLCQYYKVKEKRDLCNDTIVKYFLD
ncbi:MAG: alpha/beta hydrolase [Pleomorphochaeta sp.]